MFRIRREARKKAHLASKDKIDKLTTIIEPFATFAGGLRADSDSLGF